MREVLMSPSPADFAPAPTPADRRRWEDADQAARPERLARLRARLVGHGVDACLTLQQGDTRYLTGLRFIEGLPQGTGHGGDLLVTGTDLVVLASSSFDAFARAGLPNERVEYVGSGLPGHWARIASSVGARRVGFDPAAASLALIEALRAAAPDVELVPVGDLNAPSRVVKEPAEIERVAAACAIADRALAALLPEICPGVTEARLAWRLECLMRDFGADDQAFAMCVGAGPGAAIIHGVPGDRAVAPGQAVLFDFGAMVDTYRSDMTRVVFAGEPTRADLDVYELLAKAQQADVDAVTDAVRDVAAGRRTTLPSGSEVDAVGRAIIERGGHGDHFQHGTGHGVGIALHEPPWIVPAATDPLPSPTLFTIEPGIYLEGAVGVRIEDVILLDAGASRVECLTLFPREIVIAGR